MKLPISNLEDIKIGDIFCYYNRYSANYAFYKRISVQEADKLAQKEAICKNWVTNIIKTESGRLPVFGINLKFGNIGWLSHKETPLTKVTPTIQILFMENYDKISR